MGVITWKRLSDGIGGFDRSGLLIYETIIATTNDIRCKVWSETNPTDYKLVAIFKEKKK